MSFLSAFSSPPPDAALFVPSDRFFMRLVPLAADLPLAEQAELALEGLAPFPPAQLYWGGCVSPDRTQALVYAAHRRRFSAEETAAWNRAGLVVPAMVALCGAAPAKGPVIALVESGDALHGVAWTEGATWPSAVQARSFPEKPDGATTDKFIAELAAKAGLSVAGTTVFSLIEGPVARWEDDRLIFEQPARGKLLAGPMLPKADADLLDVRDREFLQKRREEKRRGDFIWKLMLGGLVAAGLSLVLELGALGFSLVGRMQAERVAAQTPQVQRLETANGLVGRIDELTRRQLRFFEMLALINEPRPRSIQFTRTGSNGRNVLDIEAQTPNASDVGVFETALRALPAVESAQVGEIRGRDGVTTFTMKVAFKVQNIPVAAAAPATPLAPEGAPAPVPPATPPVEGAPPPASDPTLPVPNTTPANEGGQA